MGKRVVHFDTGRNGEDGYGALVECGEIINPRSFTIGISGLEDDVTCPACLKELGISRVVDEQKRDMALAIDRDWCQVGHSLLYCTHCNAKSRDETDFNHKEKCIVPIAQQYLESLEE